MKPLATITAIAFLATLAATAQPKPTSWLIGLWDSVVQRAAQNYIILDNPATTDEERRDIQATIRAEQDLIYRNLLKMAEGGISLDFDGVIVEAIHTAGEVYETNIRIRYTPQVPVQTIYSHPPGVVPGAVRSNASDAPERFNTVPEVGR